MLAAAGPSAIWRRLWRLIGVFVVRHKARMALSLANF
jgi:hypothetical protein